MELMGTPTPAVEGVAGGVIGGNVNPRAQPRGIESVEGRRALYSISSVPKMGKRA
jgi:hypothetical protein